jgi:hypothetical protein
MGYVRSTYFEHVYDEYFHQESEFLLSKVDASTEEIIKPMVDSDRDSGTVAGIASGVGGYIAWSSGGSLASIADSLPMSDSHEQLMNEYYDSMKRPELYFGAHEGAPPIPQDVPPFLEKMARRAVKLGFIDNPEQRHEFIAINENSESRKQYFQVMDDFRRNGPPKDSNGPTPADAKPTYRCATRCHAKNGNI